MTDITLFEGNNILNVQLVPIAVPKGTLVGSVFVAGTGPNWVPIAGATVKAVGPYPSTASRTTTTASDGSYSISDLEPGAYDVYFSKSDYESYHEPVTIEAGKTAELSVALTALVANLYGVVTNAQTGYALQEVKVTIAGLTAYTNTNGEYGFTELTPGSYVIKFEKTGYNTETR